MLEIKKKNIFYNYLSQRLGSKSSYAYLNNRLVRQIDYESKRPVINDNKLVYQFSVFREQFTLLCCKK